MNKPVIAARSPQGVELTKGEDYFWCACGKSQKQPFCDGSHAGTGIKPKKFTAEEDGKAFLCLCKHSANAPFCDGTHKQLPEDGEDTPLPTARATQDPKAMPQPRRSPEEPHVEFIHELARDGLSKLGHHGEMGSMGVPRTELPSWDDIQILAAQFATKPLLDEAGVGTELIIGPRAKKPLTLDIPLFVSDMSFGALSQEAKESLSKGAEMAGTGICSGEGGMLPEEQALNSRYFYELASAQFGFEEHLLEKVQAFHFKGGQGAKTGTGGHLPGAKVTGKIAEVRNLAEGEAAVSPSTFIDLHTPQDFAKFADRVRDISGGIPIGMKLSANHIEEDIDFSIAAGMDYIILDGRGGGTGAAPLIFRDNISVPTIPALARARRHLDKTGNGDITLIVTGGLRTPADYIKAMCLGADGVAVSNSAMQAIGCVGARMCNTNNCPAGIATQKPELRAKLDVDIAAARLNRFFGASTQLMQVMARACGHDHLSKFEARDITTWKKDMAELSGIAFGGVQS